MSSKQVAIIGDDYRYRVGTWLSEQSFITAKSIKIVTFTEKRFKLKKTILNSASFSFQPFESQVSWLHRLELFSRHLERDQKALPLVSFPFYFGCRLLVVTVLQR